MAAPPTLEIDNLGELLQMLGDIPLERVRFRPSPGTATEADVLAALEAPRKRICELIGGVLVEKAMGFREADLAVFLLTLLKQFVSTHKLGLVIGPDGAVRLWPGRVRIPDVAFYSPNRLPGRRLPKEPLPTLVPDLAVEVLSYTNTKAEMRLKREDYFSMGVRLVWEVDPEKRIVEVYTSPEEPDTVLTEADTLDSGPVLPGFTLPLRDLFAELDQQF